LKWGNLGQVSGNLRKVYLSKLAGGITYTTSQVHMQSNLTICTHT